MSFFGVLNETRKVNEEELGIENKPEVEVPAGEEVVADPAGEEEAVEITSIDQAIEALKALEVDQPEKAKKVSDALIIFLEAFKEEEEGEGETDELPAHDEVEGPVVEEGKDKKASEKVPGVKADTKVDKLTKENKEDKK